MRRDARARAPANSASRIRGAIAGILGNAVLGIFSLTCVFPIVWMFYSSLKTQTQFALSTLSLPVRPILDNYVAAIKSHMGLYLLNTLRNTAISVALIVLLSFVTGYFLSRFRFRGRNLLYAYFLIGMLIPIHALLVPMFIQLKTAGLLDSWYTLLLPYVGFGLPIGIVLAESYVGGIPRELEEAAAIDGSGFSRTLFTIIMPLAAPVLAAIAIIQSFAVWNEFPFALILITSDQWITAPVGLSTVFRSEHFTDYPGLMAGIMTTMVPVLIVYFLFSNRIMKGMTAGAVKG